MAHRDYYNLGNLVGKQAKVLTQAYMQGLIDLVITVIVRIVDYINSTRK